MTRFTANLFYKCRLCEAQKVNEQPLQLFAGT